MRTITVSSISLKEYNKVVDSGVEVHFKIATPTPSVYAHYVYNRPKKPSSCACFMVNKVVDICRVCRRVNCEVEI